MRMGHFQSKHSDPHPFTGNYFFDGQGDFLGKQEEVLVIFVVYGKDIIRFFFGDRKAWPFASGLISRKARNRSSSATL